MHDSLYKAAGAGDTVNCYINGGVTIGSGDTGTPAFDVGGGWDGAVVINIFNSGRIQGCGGNGGNGSSTITQPGNVVHNTASAGRSGGTAFYTRQNINLENNAQIWGGGGGGGASHPTLTASAAAAARERMPAMVAREQQQDGILIIQCKVITEASDGGGASISQNSGFAVRRRGRRARASGANGTGGGAFSVRRKPAARAGRP